MSIQERLKNISYPESKEDKEQRMQTEYSVAHLLAKIDRTDHIYDGNQNSLPLLLPDM